MKSQDTLLFYRTQYFIISRNIESDHKNGTNKPPYINN